jgi:hypothetical protein
MHNDRFVGNSIGLQGCLHTIGGPLPFGVCIVLHMFPLLVHLAYGVLVSDRSGML